MAQLAITQTGLSGGVVALVAANGGGDAFLNNGNTRVRVNNASAASINVTFAGQHPCNHGVIHNDVVAVAAGTTVDIGPFSTGQFNDQNGNVQITYSSAASVTIGAYQ